MLEHFATFPNKIKLIASLRTQRSTKIPKHYREKYLRTIKDRKTETHSQNCSIVC